ncbi:hypothetical protein [Phascolarctobacterium succinatutens]|uniref:hypothetical protein n=1 Tax=Phascolarctobacterium succinatutens TaxID=626940 RepID=UPI0023F90D7A|nr:hypothetical protein [Phascolarctobacterium succinatutens]
MKPQAFQPGELRDEYDQIIRAGAYGKKTPFVNSDNSAILDYIINNFDALYAQIPNGRAYVKSVNNITPDSNGNVTVNVGTGGGGTGGTNITVDSTLSSTSTNPVQNKVLYAALNNKLDKNGTATYAARDSSGNIISSTYAKKTDLSSYVKSINNVKPDSAGNVNISTGGGGSNITVDTTLDSTSSNAIANKAVYAALNNKLDKTGTAAAATKATQDSYGNVIVTTYARKSDLSGYVKMINNQEPDANGNINISTGGGGSGSNITVDTTLSSTSNNPIANKAVYTALNNKLEKNGTAMYASRDSSGNVFGSTYATKTELSKCVKSINNLTPDSSGNVNISTNGGGTNITVDTTLSATSTNAIQNKAVYAALNGKLDKTGTAAAATKATQDGAGNVIATTYIKTVNNLKPDASGNVNVSAGGGGVSTSTANTWTAQQDFHDLMLYREKYTTYVVDGSDTPTTSTMFYTATGAFTLSLATLAGALSAGQSSVFTAYFAANADYTLTITNAGTIKYIGSASDVAITSAGLLLNIMMLKDNSGNLTSIVQASKLS